MSMDYVNHLLNKRRLEGERDQWHCQSKKRCSGLASCFEVGCDSVMDSPMDAWKPLEKNHLNITGSNQLAKSMVFAAQSGSAQQCCPRCMAGEPGHINHIMQRY